MRSVNRLCNWIIETGDTDEQPNDRGNTVHRLHCDSERYLVDFADDFTAEHWQQYDTDQDAHYFGVWVNPHSLRILTYAEGDWTLVSCLDNKRYNAEITSMNEFYGNGRIALVIDSDGTTTEYQQNRNHFLIGADS
jgi:hypothetical protein